MNGDGYVDKKEFKRMTNSKRINKRVIDLVFEVTYTFLAADWGHEQTIYQQEHNCLDNFGKFISITYWVY